MISKNIKASPPWAGEIILYLLYMSNWKIVGCAELSAHENPSQPGLDGCTSVTSEWLVPRDFSLDLLKSDKAQLWNPVGTEVCGSLSADIFFNVLCFFSYQRRKMGNPWHKHTSLVFFHHGPDMHTVLQHPHQPLILATMPFLNSSFLIFF